MPLAEACHQGNVSQVTYLLSNGSDPNVADKVYTRLATATAVVFAHLLLPRNTVYSTCVCVSSCVCVV